MGELTRSGDLRPATDEDLALFARAQDLQAHQRVPVLQHADNPHEYLFLALLDGTGQDANNPDELKTNVGHLYRQSQQLARDPDNRLGFVYVEGIGTQDNPFAQVFDKIDAWSWDEKIEEAYLALATQSKEWKEQDPDAQIRVAEVGYSRGAVLASGLARLVDRYGIADPEELSFGRDAQGNITVESPRRPLVAPGQTAQAMALLDPVATSMPRNFDARPASSVISGVALAANDEMRMKFPHQAIFEPGLSQDRRFVNLLVPGGHSNAGGGNQYPGLEAGAFNVTVDYLNGLRDRPLFQYRELPDDPAVYTVNQVRGLTAVPGMDRDGMRDLRTELANCKIVDPCRDGEPVNEALAAQFEYRTVSIRAPLPTSAHLQSQPGPVRQASRGALNPGDPDHPDHAMLEQIRRGVGELDRNVGKPYDDVSERLSRSLLAASKDNRDLYPGGRDISLSANALRSADHVVLGTDGRYVFAVEGDLRDPAHKRAAVEVETAIRTPVEQSDARLEAANQAIAQEQQLIQQRELQRQQTAEQAAPVHAAPVMH
jgi:hypothetical protein